MNYQFLDVDEIFALFDFALVTRDDLRIICRTFYCLA